MVYEDLVKIIEENSLSLENNKEFEIEILTTPTLTKKHRGTKEPLGVLFGNDTNIMKKSVIRGFLGGSYKKLKEETNPDEIHAEDNSMRGRNWNYFTGIVSESLDGNTKYLRIYPNEIKSYYYYASDLDVINEELSSSDLENLQWFLPVKKERNDVILMDVKLENIVSVEYKDWNRND